MHLRYWKNSLMHRRWAEGAKRIFSSFHFSSSILNHLHKKKKIFSTLNERLQSGMRKNKMWSSVGVLEEESTSIQTQNFLLVLLSVYVYIHICTPGGVVRTSRWLQLDMNKSVSRVFSLLLIFIDVRYDDHKACV